MPVAAHGSAGTASRAPGPAAPFGAEYAWRPRWSPWQRTYVRRMGVLDLPSRIRARAVLGAIRELPARRVLDVGCGAGCYAFALARDRRREVLAFDVDRVRIEESRAIARGLGLANLRFVRASEARLLPRLEGGDRDLALAVEVLALMPDPVATLRRMRNALRPGGHVVLHVFVRPWLDAWERSTFDDRSLLRALEGAGLAAVRVVPTFPGPVRALCRVGALASSAPAAAGVLFPGLLLGTRLAPPWPGAGTGRLVVARREG